MLRSISILFFFLLPGLLPAQPARIDSAWVSGSELFFQSSGESTKFKYSIEQFRWNKWVLVSSVWNNAAPGKNEYKCPVSLHGGENRFRIIAQPDSSAGNMLRYELKCFPSEQAASAKPSTVKVEGNTIELPDPQSAFEIYDQYGNIVLKGQGKAADISQLPKGGYFLNNGGSTFEFFKK